MARSSRRRPARRPPLIATAPPTTTTSRPPPPPPPPPPRPPRGPARPARPAPRPPARAPRPVDYTPYYKGIHSIFTCFAERGDAPETPDLLQAMQEHLERCEAVIPGVLASESAPDGLVYRVVQNREEVYDIVTRVMDDMPEWGELHPAAQANGWNLLWTWSRPRVNVAELLVWQKVNHFPQAKQLTRKDLLKRNVGRYKSIPGKIGEEFDIAPVTFNLPQEYATFVDEFSKHAAAEGEHNFWIMKPIGLSRGRGIFLFNSMGQVAYGESVVVQKYVARPLLLDGRKFDLRLYVLVTQTGPLEAFLYREGFGRLSTRPYSTDPKQIANRFIHLTNSSIQKHSAQGGVPHDPGIEGGTKCSLGYLRQRLAAAGVDVDLLWQRITDVILRSLYSVQEAMQAPGNANSFELFGYDVLIDANLKPWLIEVNSSPSLAVENPLDEQVKVALVRDVVRLVAPIRYDRAALQEVLRRRLADRTRQRPSTAATNQLNGDLFAVLRGAVPRGYGQPPSEPGNFAMIAPSPAYSAICARFKKPAPGPPPTRAGRG
eukprot:tig00021348_g20581.t1